MPASGRPNRQPVPRPIPAPRRVWVLDPLTGAGLLGAICFAGAIGGWMWAGLMATVAVVFVNYARQQAHQQERTRIQQENLSHFLVQGANPEELAKIRGEGEIAERNLMDFLAALKETYGGESVRGTGRLASDEQLEAVAPGITLTLAHDLGWWYAKLVLAGETGRAFLHGEYTQWKGRGRTPQDAVDALIKRVSASRQQRLIQEYAAKLVSDDE